MDQNAVEGFGLTRRFGDFLAVDHVSFDVPEGSAFGLLGLNGAGKTTTIKMLTTTLEPTAGSAVVAGADIRDEPLEVRRRIGYVGHDTTLIRPDWRPWGYLAYFGRLQGMSKAEVQEVAGPMLESLIDRKFHDQPLSTYSSGMKKRVEIVRALLHDPEVLFLDEPTKDLDILAKQNMWESFRSLIQDRDLTVFLASHDAEEIEALCDRIAVIRDGTLVFDGVVADLPPAESFRMSLVNVLREAEGGGAQDVPKGSQGAPTNGRRAPEEMLEDPPEVPPEAKRTRVPTEEATEDDEEDDGWFRGVF